MTITKENYFDSEQWPVDLRIYMPHAFNYFTCTNMYDGSVLHGVTFSKSSTPVSSWGQRNASTITFYLLLFDEWNSLNLKSANWMKGVTEQACGLFSV